MRIVCKLGVKSLRAVNLSNWRQFFMRLPCYWSWISSSHCLSSCGSADYFDNVMTKFMINNRTDALKTDVNLFFTITNSRIASSRSLTRHMNLNLKLHVTRQRTKRGLSMSFLTIIAEIHAHSLGNFYRQYANRHMNLNFKIHVSVCIFIYRRKLTIEESDVSATSWRHCQGKLN